jgi:hypothetical protein
MALDLLTLYGLYDRGASLAATDIALLSDSAGNEYGISITDLFGNIPVAVVSEVSTTVTGTVSIVKEAANAELVISCYHDTEATTPIIKMRKADNTLAAPALVDDNAVLGTWSFQGYDGTDWHEGARIEARIEGTPSDGTDMPTELTFWTTADGSGSPTQHIALNSAGNLVFANDIDFVIKANSSNALNINDGTTTVMKFDTRRTVTGVTSSLFTQPAAQTLVSAAGATYSLLGTADYTLTLTGGVGVTTLQGGSMFVGQPTYTSASPTVVTTASALYIKGPPLVAGSVTITNPFAIEVGAGDCSFNGNVGIGMTSKPLVNLQVGSANAKILLNTSTSGQTATDGFLVEGPGAGGSHVNAQLWNYENGYLRFATNNTEVAQFDATGNLLLNAPTLAGNLANGVAIKNGTAASASMADSVQLWAADAGAVAGHSGLHMRGEDDASNLVVVGYKEESANAETPQEAATPGTICKFTDSGDASGNGTYQLALDGTTWNQLA